MTHMDNFLFNKDQGFLPNEIVDLTQGQSGSSVFFMTRNHCKKLPFFRIGEWGDF